MTPMETQIVIFLAFTSVTLIFNAFVIWFAYKAFTKASTIVTETIRDVQKSDSAKAWLKGMEVASSSAVSVTETARMQLVHVDPVFARAQAKYEFKLAEIDIQLEKAFDTILEHTEKSTAGARQTGKPDWRDGSPEFVRSLIFLAVRVIAAKTLTMPVPRRSHDLLKTACLGRPASARVRSVHRRDKHRGILHHDGPPL